VRAWVRVAVCGILLAIAAPAFAVVAYQPPVTEAVIAARKEQAAAGDKYAQAELASWYFSGDYGLPVNREEAALWYRKAAEQEHELSQRQLASMYEFGEGVPADHEAALKWIRRALARYRGASMLIAGRYRAGHGVPRDSRKAAEWCRLSAEAGDLSAQNMLGEIYETGMQDYAEAAKWYRLAASADASRTLDPALHVAMANLARLFAFGPDAMRNYADAVEWYGRAIEAGDLFAPYGLGLLYEQGRGVARDSKRAIELYYFSAPISSEARERLFLLYEQDLPLPADDAGAIEWYRAAAQQGDAQARAGLGLRYKFGKGVERDWGIAYALFHLAAWSSPQGSMPDFRTPARVAESHMTPAMWNLVNEMAKPGNFLTALDRMQQLPAEARKR
jgi:uncharacterized protein